MARRERRLRQALERLIAKLPAELKEDADVGLLGKLWGHCASTSIVHLIYREKYYETQSKDCEFSRLSMENHWQAGVNDTRRTLRHEEQWLSPPDALADVRTFDITRNFD